MDYANGIMSYIMGPGLIAQIILTIVILIILYSVITIVETVVDAFKKLDRQSSILIQNTITGNEVIVQTPDSGKPLINASENEPNGMEFSYSLYLFISPETYEASGTDACDSGGAKKTKLKHIFHKGNSRGFPLLAPGLFTVADKNTLRLYMNSANKWDNYVEVPNVPVGKWFHLVITLKGRYLDVYINGNVSIRHEFSTVPKLNYGNVFVMSPSIKFPNGQDKIDVGDYQIVGPAKGMVSRLKYYAYALNYSQIDSLYREGPSKIIDSKSYSEVPPYFHDSWWVSKY